jgi:transcriptional regulator with XRE-family HTH domain
MRGNHLVREARRRAGLSQAELAERAGTTQSAIARLERGHGSPTMEHISALLRACGFDLHVRIVPADDSDWLVAQTALERSPEARVRSNTAWLAAAAELREAMVRARADTPA